jgi:hypothetical protein
MYLYNAYPIRQDRRKLPPPRVEELIFEILKVMKFGGKEGGKTKK